MSKSITDLRTVGVVSHGGAGKTSLAEAILFTTGNTKRLGKVDDGTSILDYDPEEIARKITLSSSFCRFVWKNSPITIIDTPGDFNFLVDTQTCLHGADGALVVIDSCATWQPQRLRLEGRCLARRPLTLSSCSSW